MKIKRYFIWNIIGLAMFLLIGFFYDWIDALLFAAIYIFLLIYKFIIIMECYHDAYMDGVFSMIDDVFEAMTALGYTLEEKKEMSDKMIMISQKRMQRKKVGEVPKPTHVLHHNPPSFEESQGESAQPSN